MKKLLSLLFVALIFGGLVVSCTPDNNINNDVQTDKPKVVRPGNGG